MARDNLERRKTTATEVEQLSDAISRAVEDGAHCVGCAAEPLLKPLFDDRAQLRTEVRVLRRVLSMASLVIKTHGAWDDELRRLVDECGVDNMREVRIEELEAMPCLCVRVPDNADGPCVNVYQCHRCQRLAALRAERRAEREET